VKFVDRDVRVELERQLGDRLAHVAVVMNHLANRKPQPQEVVAMLGRRCVELVAAELGSLQNVDELIEEQRDSLGKLCLGWAREALAATFTLVRAMISSRFDAMNSCNTLSIRLSADRLTKLHADLCGRDAVTSNRWLPSEPCA
jgi:hypothetical protein